MNAVSPPRRTRDDSHVWRHVGEVVEGKVYAVGLRVIVSRLTAASDGNDAEALGGFRQADEIRSQLGCSWSDLIVGQESLGTRTSRGRIGGCAP